MQSSIPATFFALTLGLLLQPIYTGSHHGSAQRHLQKRLEDVFRRFSPLVTSHATLKYNENCISPYEEKLRQEIVEELHKIATTHSTLGMVRDVIKKMEEFISMNDKELCNYRLFLVCDPDTRKCVCGPSRTNISYVWEVDRCRYAEGSMCPSSSKIECSHDTRCISMSSLEECTGELCFCQKEYYPTTTQAPTPITTTRTSIPLVTSGNGPMIIPPYENDFDDDDEDNDISSGDEEIDGDNEETSRPHKPHAKLNGLDPVLVPPTKESSVEMGSSSEEEPSQSETEDDDDVGDGERERIIVVKLGDTEKSGESPSEGSTVKPMPPSQEEEYRHLKSTTVTTPLGTSPKPTRRQELTSTIRRLEQDVERTKMLAFGNECNSLNEESNYAEYRRLVSDMDCVTGENDEENLVEILGKLEAVLVGGNMMCNTTLHLQCDSQSQRCKCRTSSEELDGFYLLFTEEDKQCVLVDNSRCLSKEYLVSRKWPVTQIPCASDSKCIAQETKAECKSKIENCFCRKPATTPKPIDASKQKKSKARGKTSSATKTKPSVFLMGSFRSYFQLVVFVGMIVYLMMLPRLVLII